MRLGKLAPIKDHLLAAPIHTFGASIAPAVLDRSTISFTPGLYNNDTLTDCTVVSIANMIGARAALNGYQAYIDPEKVIEFFAAAAGHPADLTTVEGLNYLDVINRQASLGFDTGHDRLFGIPGTIGLSRNDIALAMVRFGSVGLGVQLRQRDETEFGNGLWDTSTQDGSTIGGHAVIAWDYTGLKDTDLVRIGTWGKWQYATWRWIEARRDEVHGTRWPQLEAAI
jgi:hypothetical protein